QKRFPDGVGDPGIDAVGQDEIELSQVWAEVLYAPCVELDILQAELHNRGLANSNLARRQVNAAKPSARQREGHRNQVVSARAAQLHHPASLDLGGRLLEQSGQRGQVVRRRQKQGKALIRYLFITRTGIDLHCSVSAT